jgi:hypothetical protein
MIREAVRLPLAAGVNVIFIVQLCPAASVAGVTGQVLVCANSEASAPETVMPVINAATLPLLVTVTVFCALAEPTGCAAKVRDAGETEREGDWLAIAAELAMARTSRNLRVLRTTTSSAHLPRTSGSNDSTKSI